MAKKEDSKPATKLVLTVMEVNHGKLFAKHKHYITHLIEVPVDYKTEIIEAAAEASAEIAQETGIGKGARVLLVEEITVSKMEDIRGRAAALRALIKK